MFRKENDAVFLCIEYGAVIKGDLHRIADICKSIEGSVFMDTLDKIWCDMKGNDEL